MTPTIGRVVAVTAVVVALAGSGPALAGPAPTGPAALAGPAVEWVLPTTGAIAELASAQAHPATGTVAGPAVAGATAMVRTGGASLNLRVNASTWHDPIGQRGNGVPVSARCQLGGEEIAGLVRTTSAWLQLAEGGYVSDAYVAWQPRRPTLPWCDLPADPAPGTHPRFVEWAADHAAASREKYDVPVSVAVAQAINESGWGRSGLATQGNAYFGIKCFGIPGPVAAGCRPYPTSECDHRGCFPTHGTFRMYRSAADSFRDHGRFLTVNPRYRPAFAHTDDPNRFAREIHKAGYATDPAYSDKLIGLMREHDLYRFDR